MEPLLDQLSVAVTSAKTLEEMSRPLLDMLAAVTGMESTFLTTMDWKREVLEVLYARNEGEMQISEGISVPWGDTLCRRAIDENQPFVNDVDKRWSDCEIGRALQIQSYMSTPVRLADGELYGTLCAASSGRHVMPPQAQHIFTLFAALIAQQVEREQLVQQLMDANARLMVYASTDALTQLPNRRALQQALTRLLEQGAREQRAVLVAFVDLDGFKAINDTHGHEVGDRFLMALADRLRVLLRAEDLAARLGGDEFAVLALGPQESEQLSAAESAFQRRVFEATQGDYQLGAVEIHYDGASVGVLGVAPGTGNALEALQAADAAMYRIKQQRRSRRLQQ
ncbi:diguanylate cyclase domain-containing protein [Comamonas endophytica]|uniref:diguanylate cyclase n=1 Tax=Comamonas endophytica TaxID=2949090 RepID=A0ABY6G8J7_9BURK|nr:MULTISPECIES: diguanylate cyclase [unclassified Acidovorax]MCD2514215.1 diguanylate cyclase [Acidovorax sp. D4N7]UYG51354.1 diguanylate cyclase [Acidovorax sp. 5MLIR]